MKALFRSIDGLKGVRDVAYPAPPAVSTISSRPLCVRPLGAFIDLNSPLNMAPGSIISTEDAEFYPMLETREYELVKFIDGGNHEDSFAEYREI